jgi:hypothetical protein
LKFGTGIIKTFLQKNERVSKINIRDELEDEKMHNESEMVISACNHKCKANPNPILHQYYISTPCK